MKTREFPLTNDWTLIAHEKISVYVSVENPNEFSILDWDNDQLLMIITEESTVEVHRTSYDSKHKINISNRTFTLYAAPDDEEE